MAEKHLVVVEYPDGSSVVYEAPKEVAAVEEVTSEVVEQWNVKLRNRDGTHSWIRINPPSRGEEVVIRDLPRSLEYRTTRSQVRKDALTRIWAGEP